MPHRYYYWLLVGLNCVACAGCASLEYPPAVPAHLVAPQPVPYTPPLTCYVPQASLALLPVRLPAQLTPPTADEWRKLWRVQAIPKTVCRGKGKQRKCTTTVPNAVDQANTDAAVRPTERNTKLGQSAQVHYALDPRNEKVYQVVTSPEEFTYFILPPGEKLALKLLIDDMDSWEVRYGSHNEIIAVRPLTTPQRVRTLLGLQSGVAIHLDLVAQERRGMLSVTWELPTAGVPPPPPPDQIPPTFDNALAYTGYVIAVDGKTPPPWLPEGVVDDGKNTLIRFPGLGEGMRLPIASGIQQNGKPALVQSRLYIRREHGAWLYVQGLWPALELTDAAGMKVKITRQSPNAPTTEVTYAPAHNTRAPASAARLTSQF